MNAHDVDERADLDAREELRRTYEAHDTDPQRQSEWSPTHPLELFYRLGRMRAIAALLRQRSRHLDGADILDVGCGFGRSMTDLVALGADPARLAGVDVLDDRVERARAVFPQSDVRIGDAEHLPWPDASFDVISQFTALSSQAVERRRTTAKEMLRVLRPGGFVVSWDLIRQFADSPIGLSERDLGVLFAPAEISTIRTGLDPRIASRLVERFGLVASALSATHFRPSHLAALVTVRSIRGPRV